MLSELEEIFDEFIDRWDTEVSGRILKVRQQSLTEQEIKDIILDIDSLRQYFSGRNLIVNLQYEHNAFDYTIIWESNGNIIAQRNSDSDLPPDRLFSEEDARLGIEVLRDNRITSIDDLQVSLADLLEAAEVNGDLRYDIPAESVDRYLEYKIDKNVRISYYFTEEGLKLDSEELDLSEVKDFYYANDAKRLFVVRELDQPVYGSSIGFFPPSQIDNRLLRKFLNRTSIYDK